MLGFNNFQILKTTIANQNYEKVVLEVNNSFYIKDLKNCDDYYSKFTVQNAFEKNSDKIVKFSKLTKYTSKNLNIFWIINFSLIANYSPFMKICNKYISFICFFLYLQSF